MTIFNPLPKDPTAVRKWPESLGKARGTRPRGLDLPCVQMDGAQGAVSGRLL